MSCDINKTADRIGDGIEAAQDAKKATKSISSSRASAVREAWKNERDLVATTGRDTRAWTAEEMTELLNTGKVKGCHGHHMQSVKARPDLAGDPTNIQFLSRAKHLEAHDGNWRNPTYGRFIK